MNQQRQLTYEDLKDALMFMFRLSNKGIKEVHNHLYLEKSFQRFMENFDDTFLPRGKKECNFLFEEVMNMMKFCQQYDPLYYLCDELGFERPIKKCIVDKETA